MGSGTSYFNMTLFRKNLARFWPIWGLYALIWVVLLPAGVLLRRDVWDKGNAWEFPLVLLEALPLTLEEIFIYELGGEDYAVRDIVL